ncbi:MAG: hypothetical protein ACR2OB_12625 [Solirubrobacteraceae bacterium]
MTTLLAVPNVSEGRDPDAIRAIVKAFEGLRDDAGARASPREQAGAFTAPRGQVSATATRLLDLHSDADHHRSVFTLAGEPGRLAGPVTCGAREAMRRIDLARHIGIHPRVGAIDVAPIVYLDERDRGPAIAEALVLADTLGHELGLPVFLYGELADGRTRAQIRNGGLAALAERIANGELRPDFGPMRLHPTAGAVLVAARPPLVAFNVELASPATVEDARAIAAKIRQGGPEGLVSVRAIGLWLAHRGVAQVSTNVEDHRATPLREIVSAVARHARASAAELVGLAPRVAFDGFPDDVPVRGRATIEDAIAATPSKLS